MHKLDTATANIADHHCDEALKLYRAGQLDDAETEFRRAIDIDPKHYRTHFLFSDILVMQDRLEEAKIHALMALRINPNPSLKDTCTQILATLAYRYAEELTNIDNIIDIGKELMSLQSYGEAESVFRFILELQIEDTSASFYLVKLLVAENRIEEAKSICDNYSATYWGMYALGYLLDHTSARDASEDAYLSALAIKPDSLEIQNIFIDRYGQEPEIEKRLRSYEKVAQKVPGCGLALHHEALVHHLNGDIKKSVEKHAEALAHLPIFCPLLHQDIMDDESGKLIFHDIEFRSKLENGDYEQRKTFQLLAEPERISTIIAINFWGRSGSYLLSTLFDGHPGVLQILPHHSLADALAKVSSLMAASADSQDSINNIVNGIVDLFERNSNKQSWTALPEGKAGIFSECLRFSLQMMQRKKCINPGMIFRAIHVAHAIAIGRENICDAPIIVYQAHNGSTQYRQQLNNIFPAMKFILCVRFPERSYDSHLNHHCYESPFPYPLNVPRILFDWLIDMGEVTPEIDHEHNRSTVVRFEDVHTQTETVMRWLANWLGIEWDPGLMISTFNGNLYTFSSGYAGNKHQGARPLTQADFNTKLLHWADKIKINYVLSENIHAWLYDAPLSPFARFLIKNKSSGWIIENILIHLPMKIHLVLARELLQKNGFKQAYSAFRSAHREMKLAIADGIKRKKQGITPIPLLYANNPGFNHTIRVTR